MVVMRSLYPRLIFGFLSLFSLRCRFTQEVQAKVLPSRCPGFRGGMRGLVLLFFLSLRFPSSFQSHPFLFSCREFFWRLKMPTMSLRRSTSTSSDSRWSWNGSSSLSCWVSALRGFSLPHPSSPNPGFCYLSQRESKTCFGAPVHTAR